MKPTRRQIEVLEALAGSQGIDTTGAERLHLYSLVKRIKPSVKLPAWWW